MPVNYKQSSGTEVLYQRSQYKKGGITTLYWDYRDRAILKNMPADAKVILDAGCGEGITMEKIIRRYPDSQVYGVDICEENIAICKRFSLPASHGDIFHLPMQDNTVDCCVLSEVIEHLDQPELVFAEIRRILKTGGRLIIVFPNDRILKLARLFTFKFKEAYYDAGHLRQWTASEMRHYLLSAGFAVVNLCNIPFYFWPLSLHCIVIAVKQK